MIGNQCFGYGVNKWWRLAVIMLTVAIPIAAIAIACIAMASIIIARLGQPGLQDLKAPPARQAQQAQQE